ncbi:hypothetical protein [Streptomyces sp. S.PB5]|uniref:hypothetical protein n=1 Tax=Streptomyces sp. S.PB5 TaxID=3020844 RepID=UPI0025B0AB20|nr:hypothetical protein [Streptomyces sp. S.PB5]MDN3024551.1 hypothetical protein [Streptomyces sp. S.PB5]
MLRHEFHPGRLIAGFFVTLAGITYAGDAGGAWETPWFAVIPMLTVGLCLAGAVGLLTRSVRRRRAALGTRAGSGPEPEIPG